MNPELLKLLDDLGLLNPFVPNAPFLQAPKVFWCFHGIQKGRSGNEWVNLIQFWPMISFLAKFAGDRKWDIAQKWVKCYSDNLGKYM